jgi:hypothetical protein
VLGNLGANVGDSEYQFMRWFDLIGVQRHLKVLGIFARLWHRDGKIGYLADLPLTLEYVRDACRRYPELVEFERWLAWRVEPQLAPATARQNVKSPRVASRRKAKPKPKRKPGVIKKKAVAAKKKLKRVLLKARAARKTRKAKRLTKRVIKRSVKRVIKRVKRGGRKLTARRRRTPRLHK